MSLAVPADVRRLVADRAARACEYCRIPESLTYFGCQIDHIVSIKHGGKTTPHRLARVSASSMKFVFGCPPTLASDSISWSDCVAADVDVLAVLEDVPGGFRLLARLRGLRRVGGEIDGVVADRQSLHVVNL